MAQVRTFLRDEQGRIYLNPAKDYIQPFELTLDSPNQEVTIPASNRRGSFTATAQFDGPIEIFYVKALVKDQSGAVITDYNIRIAFEHPGKRVLMQNRSVPLIAIAGDGGRPFILPETIMIPPIQSLNITYFNDDTQVRTVQLVLGGIKYYPNAAPQDIRDDIWKYVELRKRTYTYFQTSEQPISMTALQTDAIGNIRVPDDADLEIFKLTGQSTGRFQARIRDAQNDRGLMNSKIDGSLLFGGHIATAIGAGIGGSGGIFPARWATTWLVRRSVRFRIEVDDLSNAVNTFNPVFAGRKIAYAK